MVVLSDSLPLLLNFKILGRHPLQEGAIDGAKKPS